MFFKTSLRYDVWHMADIAEKACSKCGKPREGKDRYCKECRATYNQDYGARDEWQAERRGILRGILGMRQHAADYFRQWPGRPFMGAEVASVVDSLPGPAVADEAAKER